MTDEVRLHIKDLLAAGIIRHSHLPISASVLLVRKSEGTLRLLITGNLTIEL